jgi:hypothetical protein
MTRSPAVHYDRSFHGALFCWPLDRGGTMRRIRLTALLNLITLSVATSFAQEGSRPLLTERLTGLGRVWGAVTFFHPFLAYKAIWSHNVCANSVSEWRSVPHAPTSGCWSSAKG